MMAFQQQKSYQQYLPGSVSRTRLVPTVPMRREVTDEEIEEVTAAFHTFDHEGTGAIDYREFKVAMRALGFPVKKKDVLALLQDYSKDQGSLITEAEFKEILLKKVSEREMSEKLHKAFQLFDDDATGRITIKNLRRIAKDMGDTISENELGSMIDEFDKDGDGEINAEEFFAIMEVASA